MIEMIFCSAQPFEHSTRIPLSVVEAMSVQIPSCFSVMSFYKSGVLKVTRFYAGADGQSHFDDIEVETEKLQPGDGIIFRDATRGPS